MQNPSVLLILTSETCPYCVVMRPVADNVIYKLSDISPNLLVARYDVNMNRCINALTCNAPNTLALRAHTAKFAKQYNGTIPALYHITQHESDVTEHKYNGARSADAIIRWVQDPNKPVIAKEAAADERNSAENVRSKSEKDPKGGVKCKADDYADFVDAGKWRKEYCTDRNLYKKTRMNIHPDRNLNCIKDAEAKFKAFDNMHEIMCNAEARASRPKIKSNHPQAKPIITKNKRAYSTVTSRCSLERGQLTPDTRVYGTSNNGCPRYMIRVNNCCQVDIGKLRKALNMGNEVKLLVGLIKKDKNMTKNEQKQLIQYIATRDKRFDEIIKQIPWQSKKEYDWIIDLATSFIKAVQKRLQMGLNACKVIFDAIKKMFYKKDSKVQAANSTNDQKKQPTGVFQKAKSAYKSVGDYIKNFGYKDVLGGVTGAAAGIGVTGAAAGIATGATLGAVGMPILAVGALAGAAGGLFVANKGILATLAIAWNGIQSLAITMFEKIRMMVGIFFKDPLVVVALVDMLLKIKNILCGEIGTILKAPKLRHAFKQHGGQSGFMSVGKNILSEIVNVTNKYATNKPVQQTKDMIKNTKELRGVMWDAYTSQDSNEGGDTADAAAVSSTAGMHAITSANPNGVFSAIRGAAGAVYNRTFGVTEEAAEEMAEEQVKEMLDAGKKESQVFNDTPQQLESVENAIKDISSKAGGIVSTIYDTMIQLFSFSPYLYTILKSTFISRTLESAIVNAVEYNMYENSARETYNKIMDIFNMVDCMQQYRSRRLDMFTEILQGEAKGFLDEMKLKGTLKAVPLTGMQKITQGIADSYTALKSATNTAYNAVTFITGPITTSKVVGWGVSLTKELIKYRGVANAGSLMAKGGALLSSAGTLLTTASTAVVGVINSFWFLSAVAVLFVGMHSYTVYKRYTTPSATERAKTKSKIKDMIEKGIQDHLQNVQALQGALYIGYGWEWQSDEAKAEWNQKISKMYCVGIMHKALEYISSAQTDLHRLKREVEYTISDDFGSIFRRDAAMRRWRDAAQLVIKTKKEEDPNLDVNTVDFSNGSEAHKETSATYMKLKQEDAHRAEDHLKHVSDNRELLFEVMKEAQCFDDRLIDLNSGLGVEVSAIDGLVSNLGSSLSFAASGIASGVSVAATKAVGVVGSGVSALGKKTVSGVSSVFFGPSNTSSTDDNEVEPLTKATPAGRKRKHRARSSHAAGRLLKRLKQAETRLLMLGCDVLLSFKSEQKLPTQIRSAMNKRRRQNKRGGRTLVHVTVHDKGYSKLKAKPQKIRVTATGLQDIVDNVKGACVVTRVLAKMKVLKHFRRDALGVYI